MNNMNKRITKGEKFVEELLSGKIQKNYRTNRGSDFTGGFEGLYYDYFERYLCSCGCYMMDRRLKREGYYGRL